MKISYIVCVLVLFFVCFGCVSAGENDTGVSYVVNDSVVALSDDSVVALEDGHFNTSFSDGSNGYCLEYGEQEASKGDVFYKVSTDYAVNNYDDSKVGNYLKLYFTDYTSHALSDKVVCQHMIWHFTDDFNGWRVNYTIVDEIKKSDKIIPDYYVQKLNSTHERVWFFNVLLSLYEHHQDYFSYRFWDRLISECNVSDNNTVNNTTVPIINDTGFCGNCSIVKYNDSRVTVDTDVQMTSESVSGGVMLVTGVNLYNTVSVLFILCLVLLLLLFVKRKYY